MESTKVNSGTMILDKNYRIVCMNESFREYYPMAKLGMTCYKSIYGLDRPCPNCDLTTRKNREMPIFDYKKEKWMNGKFEKIQMIGQDECYCITLQPALNQNADVLDPRKQDVLDRNRYLLEMSPLWNSALNQMPNGYHRCNCDEDYTFLFLSDRFCQLVGYTRDEIKDKFDNKMRAMIHPEDQKTVSEFFHALVPDSNETSYGEFLYRLQSKKGYIWVVDSSRLTVLEQQRFFQGAITDVTDYVENQQQAKNALLTTKNRIDQYKKALISRANAVYEINVTKEVVENISFSHEGKEMSRMAPFDIDLPCEYHRFLDMVVSRVPEDEQARCREKNSLSYFMKCFRSGKLKWQAEYDTWSMSNARMHIRKNYTLTQNAETGDIYALIVARDITKEEQEKQDQAFVLKNQKEELSVALEYAEQRLKVIDGLCSEYPIVLYVDAKKDTCIPYALPKKEKNIFKITGYNEIPFTNRILSYFQMYVVPEDCSYVHSITTKDVVLRELEKKNSYNINYQMYIGDHVEHYQLRIIRIGSQYEQVWAFRSIESIVKEELRQQKVLQTALEEAQKAEKAKSFFLFNMSHDIRTPMNAIIGFNEKAREYCNNEKAIDALRKSRIASQHLLDLINEVLEMARIENGKIELKEKVICVTDYFDEIKEMFEFSMRQRGINFVTDFQFTEKYIYLDGTRIMQVINNLLGNAMKFTPRGGTVSYMSKELRKTKDGRVLWQIRVKDTGVGMAKEFQERLFEAFEREKTSTTSGVTGTGLGLAIAKNIADLMGATLECESEVGRGTEFIFTFSAKIGQPPEQENTKSKIRKTKFSGKRILLVEDNELNREIAMEILTKFGFTVEEASNGLVSVMKMKNSKPGYYDLVLMDIQMPVMDGYKATYEIRHLADPELASVPIVAMTANAFAEDREKTMAAGMNGHLAKPIDIKKLEELLEQTLNEKKNKKSGDCTTEMIHF